MEGAVGHEVWELSLPVLLPVIRNAAVMKD
jgi:hypothetical protein